MAWTEAPGRKSHTPVQSYLKRSTSASRPVSRSESQPSLAESCSGGLLDLYARSLGSKSALKRQGAEAVGRALRARQIGRRALGEFADAIDRDELHFRLLDSLASFHKARKTWGKADFRKVAQGVLKLKREEAALAAEVRRALGGRRPPRAALLEKKEALLERTAKTKSFWEEYRTAVRRPLPLPELEELTRTRSAPGALPPIGKAPVARPLRQPRAAGASPTQDYVVECGLKKSLPTPLPFLTGHGLDFRLYGKLLTDRDLHAASAALPGLAAIEDVDLEGSRALTDRALAPFLKRLRKHGSVAAVRKLSLRHCAGTGSAALTEAVALLHAAAGLLELDVSGVALSAAVQPVFCEAVRKHEKMRSLRIADVGLGACGAGERCVGLLLASRSLETLDLGWNCLDKEVFKHLGDCVAANPRLKSLALANCSGAGGRDSPAEYFLEKLALDRSLTSLDVSLNRLSCCGALVLEESLKQQKKLVKLAVDENPLGVPGLRSVLRLLLSKRTALVQVSCEGCGSGAGGPVLSPCAPGGRYDLDLSRPWHRATLRGLCGLAERMRCAPDAVLTEGDVSMVKKDGAGRWAVPEAGKLSLVFSTERCMERLEAKEPSEALARHYGMSRSKMPLGKAAPLFSLWRRLQGREQAVLLEALAKGFEVSLAVAVELCKGGASPEVVPRLLPALAGGPAARHLLTLQAGTLGEFAKSQRALGRFASFNSDNPTGHYRLDLGCAAEHAVAERLLLIDSWEAALARREGRHPVSQKGDQTNVRNESWQKEDLGVPVQQWRLPESDVLELDYATGRRPPADAKALDDKSFDAVMAALHAAECEQREVVKVLVLLSSHFFVRAMQLRELLGLFRGDEARADVFVTFYTRVVDIENEKVFRARFADKPEELMKLRRRLGAATMMPFLQPEQAQFELDMARFDERLCACLVVELAGKESPLRNMRCPSFTHADGRVDPLQLGVPRSWAVFEKCPKSGVFKVSYECSPEDRCFAQRLRLMETYGFWRRSVAEEEVMWWATLTEAHPDVLEFLEFLVGKFKDVQEVFPIMDGENSNGLVSLRKFEDGLKALKCQRFKGPNEKERVANVFRFLDCSGEGQVSRVEWAVLDKLWREMQHSVREFVQFLERTFGNLAMEQDVDVLDAAWAYIDEDGSGEIDEKEWSDMVREGLKYFGPCRIIFNFLDKDGEGTISRREFRALEIFQRGEG